MEIRNLHIGWSIIALYVLLIFMTIADVVRLMDFFQTFFGIKFNIFLNMLPFFALVFLLGYISLIRKERRPFPYLLIILIAILCSLSMSFLYFPAEKVHLIEYGVLGGLLYWITSQHKKSVAMCYFIAIIGSFIIGGADELFQSLFPSRVCDMRDIIINNYSGLLGAILYSGVLKRQRSDE